jgi:serine/threonine-protein kinase
VVRLGESGPVASQIDAEVLMAPSHPEMLGRIDQFEVERKIGQGGMGVVYRGFDSALNRPVAIKVLAPHLASSGIARKRFAREAKAAAAVVHPNVVPIYSVKDSSTRLYIVMALVDGRSLQEHVSERGSLEIKDVVRVAHQVAAGLAAAHQQGLIHRDIKPANVLLEKDVSRVMITDFGLARAADDAAMTRTGWLAGTPHYMSPEQAQGKDVDQRSDLFSLGSTIYFMATGREPFRAETPLAVLEQIKNESAVQARDVNSDIPPTLNRIVQRLLAKDPTDRIESAKELEQVLARYLAHLQHPQSNAEPALGVLPSTLRNVKRVALGLTVSALIAFCCWRFGPSPSKTITDPAKPPAAIAGNSEPESKQWMQGLQPIDQWERDADQLERELLELEHLQDAARRRVPTSVDPRPIWSGREFKELDHEIQQMQQQLP